jgi:plastocyanin
LVRGLRLTRLALAALTGLALLAAAATVAHAANRRVAIANYRWSTEDVQVNLGEHVTWYWTGPDTIHSVTGNDPNPLGVDSDPLSETPRHNVGDSFEVTFNKPGVYAFHCKLHPFVRGTVTVSSSPGDPASEPDPIPKNNIDLTKPTLREVRLASTRFRRRGTTLHLALDKRADLDAEIYRDPKHGKHDFAGYRKWKDAHIGFNDVDFGGASKHFKPRPGRYVAKLTATDDVNNESRKTKLRFRIRR